MSGPLTPGADGGDIVISGVPLIISGQSVTVSTWSSDSDLIEVVPLPEGPDVAPPVPDNSLVLSNLQTLTGGVQDGDGALVYRPGPPSILGLLSGSALATCPTPSLPDDPYSPGFGTSSTSSMLPTGPSATA